MKLAQMRLIKALKSTFPLHPTKRNLGALQAQIMH